MNILLIRGKGVVLYRLFSGTAVFLQRFRHHAGVGTLIACGETVLRFHEGIEEAGTEGNNTARLKQLILLLVLADSMGGTRANFVLVPDRKL